MIASICNIKQCVENKNISSKDKMLDVNIGNCLNDVQKLQLKELINQYSNIFRKEPGRVNCYQHNLEVSDNTAVIQRTYPIPLHYRDQVDKEIENMLKCGIIERASSQFINPMVVVTKPNGKIRLCLDARKLNSILLPDYECARSTEELFQKCAGVKFMSKLDLTSGFWQIPIRKCDRKYTAFLYRNKCYQFTVVPFGLSTSLAAMVRCLDKVMGTEVEDYTLVFVDDILCVSHTFEEHLIHLKKIFKKFQDANMTINLEKSEFGKEELKFLGHIISTNGITTNPDKVKSIMEFPTPGNTKQLKSFLGLTNYYNKFSSNYAECTVPLLPLLRKGVKWNWDMKHQKAFENVKQVFIKTVVLHHPVEMLVNSLSVRNYIR